MDKEWTVSAGYAVGERNKIRGEAARGQLRGGGGKKVADSVSDSVRQALPRYAALRRRAML